ncbi:hypothetical protein MMC22_008440 [Lobaria immixta]|nr:hypothetical protein [Lobaria immixta]
MTFSQCWGGPRRPLSRVSRSPADEILERASEKKAQDRINFVLSTRLAHPIQFDFRRLNCDDDTACHWCDDIAYGILGLGVVQVSVMDCGDGEGYVELEHGHTAIGHLPSRMCSHCTKLRVSIVGCKIHEMQEIPMMQGVAVDQKDYLELCLGESGPLEWCSVCPDVAHYACAKSDILSLDDYGCGLRLCTICMVKLVGNHDGNLTSFLTELFKDVQQGQHATLGVRADAEFLHPEEELMRRVHHNLTHAEVTKAKPAHPKAFRSSPLLDPKFEIEGSKSGSNSGSNSGFNSGSNSGSNSTSRKRRFESAFKYS